MPLTTGQLLQKRYRIVALLGQGGMGAVYRAWDNHLDLPVAIKELVPQPGIDAAMLGRLRQQFFQEAQILGRLDHPHLVKVSDYFEEGGNPYLVMRYVEGEDLATRIEREGALDEAQVLVWTEQLLEALIYCHGQGVIHRDIKPQNVILTPEGKVVLVDFGLVKLWDPNDPRTRTAIRGAGTPEYAPPEQYDAVAGHTDPRSDVYSVGASLYHALTGQPPPTAAQRMADPEDFVPPRAVNPDVSAEAEGLVLRAMAIARSQRFDSAQEMRLALLQGPPPLVPGGTQPLPSAAAASAPATSRFPWWQRVPSWGWALTALTLVLLLAVGVGGWALSNLVPALSSLAGGATPAPRTEAPVVEAPGGTPIPTLEPVMPTMPAPQPGAVISGENARQILQLARWGKGRVGEIAYAPQGDVLAVTFSAGIALYDAETSEVVRFMDTDREILSLAFGPNGETLFAGSEVGVVEVRRVSDGTLLNTLEGPEYEVGSLALSPDGEILASGSNDNIARLWRLSDGELLHLLDKHTDDVWALAFSPQGELLASGAGDGAVRLWSVSDGSLLQTLPGHPDGVTILAFSPDGDTLVAGAGDESLRFWQLSDGALLRTLEKDTRRILDVSFSPDGGMLATESYGDDIHLWRLSDDSLLHTLEGHTEDVESAAFSPDGGRLVSVSEDDTLRSWQTSNGAPMYATGFMEVGPVVAFSPDGEVLTTGGHDDLHVWQASGGTLLHALEGEDVAYISSLNFSPDGSTLAVGTWKAVQLWQVADGTRLHTLVGHTRDVECMAFSPDGQMVASGSMDATVRLWQASDGAFIDVLEGHTDSVTGLVFTSDGETLISGGWDRTLRLWDISGCTRLPAEGCAAPLRVLEEEQGMVLDMALSPDGEILAVGGSGWQDEVIKLWQLPDMTLLRTLGEAADAPLGRSFDRADIVTFSPDGSILASRSEDGLIRLWRVSDGTLLHTLEGYAGGVQDLAFSPDGKLLVLGTGDGTVRFWGVER